MTVALATMAATGAKAQTPSPASASAPIGVTPRTARATAYLHELANPRGLAFATAGAAIERFRFGERADFADELAFRMTKRAVGVSVRHGLAAAMHLSTDNSYHFCECTGFGPRVVHALVQTFTDEREGGGRALAVPRLAAHYAENVTSMAWNHDRSITNVVSSTSLSLGAQALFNIGRELTRINIRIHP